MQPVRSADYPAHPHLRDVMALAEDAASPDSDLTFEEVFGAWRSYLGRADIPVLLVRSTDRARKLLMEAFGIADPDVESVEITVELQTLKLNRLHNYAVNFIH